MGRMGPECEFCGRIGTGEVLHPEGFSGTVWTAQMEV